MSKSIDFNVSISEKHHTKKNDKPSGTAIKIAEDILTNYSWSKEYGNPFTFTEEGQDKFLLTTVKNVTLDGNNIGYLAISENANDIRSAINERKTFILRTAVFIGVVIFIFSFVFQAFPFFHRKNGKAPWYLHGFTALLRPFFFFLLLPSSSFFFLLLLSLSSYLDGFTDLLSSFFFFPLLPSSFFFFLLLPSSTFFFLLQPSST